MSRRFSVRPVRRRDFPRILEIEAASFGADAYDRKLFAEYARLAPRLFLVVLAGDGGNVAGKGRAAAAGKRLANRSPEASPTGLAEVCGYSISYVLRGGERAELVSLAVDPAFLGSGAATALMESSLRRLRLRGVKRFTLTVKATNARARRFYEKYGFRKLRSAPKYYEDGEDGILMTRDL
jgi:ribosomal-protein-alanine N-acetyltransferase